MTKNKCLFDFQFFEANNISLESSTFADFKNHIFKTLVAELQSFLFQKFYSIRPHSSKQDTDCEGPRKRADTRSCCERGNSVVGELIADSCPGDPSDYCYTIKASVA